MRDVHIDRFICIALVGSTAMREAQQWADAHADELQSALDRHEPRASEMVQTLVKERVPFRNSVVEEIHKWYDGDMDEAVATAYRLGGGFFQKVFAGDYAGAYLHADKNNQVIIERAYDRQFVADNADGGYEARVVRERWTDGEE